MNTSRFPLLLVLSLVIAACSRPSGEPAQLQPGERVSISILATTDLHGWVLPFDYALDQVDGRYGLAKVATLIDSVRGVNEHTLLFDAGDFIQGNQFAEYFARIADDSPSYPLLSVMEYLGFEATVVGNHEFNFGVPYLDHRISQTSIPVLGGNVYVAGTQDPYYTPYIIRNVGGVRVGIVGLTTPGSAVWDRPRVTGIVDFGDGVEAASRFVAEVREAGAEFVVILQHSAIEPGSSYEMEGVSMENFGRAVIETVPGIDAMITAHSHRVVDDITLTSPDGRAIPVIQAGRWGSHLGIIELELQKHADGSIETILFSTRSHSVSHTDVHPVVAAMVEDAHQEVRSHVNRVVGQTPDLWDASNARLEDNPIVDLIHEVQLEITGAQLSAASAFNTNAQFGPGEITRRDLAQIYPFENMLYTLQINGAQLRAFLEHTSQYFAVVRDGAPHINTSWAGYNFDTLAGIDYEIHIGRPVGQRIRNMRYEGRPVNDSDLFTIAINSYRAEGGGGFSMLFDAPVLWESDRAIRTYIQGFLEARATITHSDVFTQNWRLVY
jgi:2',3'-cyclic-nucleotide 2'-phosphodiesterase/3'-nucleotidase